MEENHFQDEEEKPSILKRVFIVIITIFLLILILSYFSLWGVRDIISGLAESNKIKDNEIHFSDKTVLFENNTYEKLLQIYNNNKGKEIKVCLIGIFEDKNKHYYINNLYIPKIYEQDFNRVVSEPCYDSIVSLHSHPRMFCIPSKQDFKSFTLYDKENNLMMVMCKENRFTVYPK